jgi:CheY-like chemotaxis protein
MADLVPPPQTHDRREPAIRLLVADDDRLLRSLLVSWARAAVEGIVVIEAENGSEAVELGVHRRPQIALLDVEMPCLDGIEAAVTLRELRPEIRVALQTADVAAHGARAHEHCLPLFDNVGLDRALGWLQAQVRARTEAANGGSTKRSLVCTLCGYGVFRAEPPGRCPMCQAENAWLHAPARSSLLVTA